jgi:hypothetical protein
MSLTKVSSAVLNVDDLYGFRNRIINGDMRIDQRNAGASVTPTTSGTYNIDRWLSSLSQSSKFSVQQNAGSVTPPPGFTNYLGVTSLSSYTVGSAEAFQIQQRIEGFNVQDFAWGTPSAKNIVVSFWVRSSLTGLFGGAVRNGNGFTYSYPFSYTINSANTWEYKTILIPGDTVSSWLFNSTTSIALSFSLGAGSSFSGTAGNWVSENYISATGATSVVGTNGATFYITGVQLELGTVATPFERRPYGTELSLCQRYYYRISAEGSATTYLSQGQAESTTGAIAVSFFPVSMRVAPSALEQTGTASDYRIRIDGTNVTFSSVPAFQNATTYNAAISCSVASGLAAGKALSIRPNTSAVAYLAWSAEL